jgi:hypothetical protein
VFVNCVIIIIVIILVVVTSIMYKVNNIYIYSILSIHTPVGVCAPLRPRNGLRPRPCGAHRAPRRR